MIATQEQDLAGQLKLRSLLEAIALAIGRRTKVPEIEHYANDAMFTLAVDPHDQGRFIGKLGSTIWAVQTILWYAGLTQFGWSYSVWLLVPAKSGTERRPVPFKFNLNGTARKLKIWLARFVRPDDHTATGRLGTQSGESDRAPEADAVSEDHLTRSSFVDAFETVRVAGME
jgi:hypothetical protein